jgi:effector-binding domain-containing protein
MPKFEVTQSILIAAPVDQVHDLVRDFRRWPEWSPWLIAEPDARIEFGPDGTSYRWDGRITGAGEMKLTGGQRPRSIDLHLTFLNPWKSENTVGFRFSDRGDGTEVSWTMSGSLPFFMFWMKPMMTAFVGADYQRGLMMLKALIETGSVPSKLEFSGRRPFPGCRFIGISTTCGIDETGPRMAKDMDELGAWISRTGTRPAGAPFSIYHKWNPAKDVCRYTVGFPLEIAPATLDPGFIIGEIPSCETDRIVHTGPYPFLGNAWSAGIMRQRAKVFRNNRKIAPFEIYQNDPRVVPADELVTVLHFPVK